MPRRPLNDLSQDQESQQIMRLRTIYLLSFIFLFSCSTEPVWKEVDINSKVRISLPEGFLLSSAPNPHAIAHYEDTMHSLFLMIIPESKDTMKAYELDYNLSTYFDEVCADLLSKLSGGKVSGISPKKIGTLASFQGTIEGTSGSQPVRYEVAAVESVEYYYQIITAFPAEDSLKYKDRMLKSIASFREL